MAGRELIDDQTRRILVNLPDLDGTTQLALKDLPYLRMAMINISTHWYNIGIHFHIPTTTLDKFRSKNRNDSDSCLTCVLVEWLTNWNQKYGPPTWRKVVIAVSSRVGGDNPAEASRIGKQYKDYGSVSAFKDSDKVDNRSLRSEDLDFIVAHLMSGVAVHWAAIGLFLGIPHKYIEIFKLEDTLDQRVTEMVSAWLKRKHDTKVFGEPTWRRLVEAVASRSGGGNQHLAAEIAAQHPLCYGGATADVADVTSSAPVTDVLTEGDLALLMNLLDSVAYNWEFLCLQLGVPKSDLNNIAANPMRLSGAPKTHLHDGLYTWIQLKAEQCTISALCQALKEVSVDEQVLSVEVERELKRRRGLV